MKYYFVAGEASGDLHGSHLIKELKKLDPSAEMRGWGGDKMQDQGVEIVKHFRDLAFMGFAEVIKNLPTILDNIRFCKKDIDAFQPDVLVLIDYPGFNLRIAKWARSKNLKVVYYISPTIWAWNEKRVHGIKKNVDKMLVILPFEKVFYEKWKYVNAVYTGHPLMGIVEEFKAGDQPILFGGREIIALLPGSRKQELNKMLPVMLEVTRKFPQYQFVIAQAPGLTDEYYQQFTKGSENIELRKGKTYQILSEAKAAIVTSGTATLETALFDVPQVVCYKTSPVSYSIGKRVIKVKYISLVNLILDRFVVKELIQDEMTADNISVELKKITEDEGYISTMKTGYQELRKKLQQERTASEIAAEEIYETVIGQGLKQFQA